jgi:site-specific DNA recombinase
MSLAAMYLRLSRNEEQLDIEEVLTSHKNALTKLANQHNLTFDMYQEISSGVNIDRAELNKLLSKLDEYDYLLVMDIDRISRESAYTEQIKQLLLMNDVKILTPSGSIDLSQETNEMMFSMQAIFANFEYKQIRKRLGRGRLAAAEQGRWVMSNQVPLGYKKNEEQRLEVVPEEAKIIRFIFEKTVERMSSNEIAKQLDVLGWRSRSGKVLTTSHISSIRRNVVYRGIIHASRRTNGRVVDEVWVEDAHEPIITRQQWLEVEKLLEDNKDKKFFNKKKATRRLQNLLYCYNCTRKRYLQTDGKQDYIKSCSYKVSNNTCKDRGAKYEEVEKFVLQKIKAKKPEFEEALSKLKSLDTSEVEERLIEERKSLLKQIDRFENRLKNLKEMRMDGEISKSEFIELRDANEEQIKKMLRQIELIDIQIEDVNNTEEEEERLEYTISMLDRLDELPAEECNTFLKTFIEKIWFCSNSEVNHNTTQERKEATIKVKFRD